MALEAVVEIIARAFGPLVSEILYAKIFYWIGWGLLRVITLGSYPPHQKQPHNRDFVSLLALATLLAGLTFYFS